MDTVVKLGKMKQTTVGREMLGEFTVAFGRSSLLSILCGFVAGGLACFYFKYMKPLRLSAIVEIYVILLMAMITHTFAELEVIDLAGVVVLFIFGIVQSHYNRHNYTEEAVEKAGFVFELAGLICESMTFLYMGLSFDKPRLIAAPTLIFACVDLVILFVSRVVSILALTALANKFGTKKHSVSNKEAILIAVGGLTRGAIPYALAVHLSQGEGQTKFIQNMIPICQVMIVRSIILFVPLNQVVFRALLGKNKRDGSQESDSDSGEDDELDIAEFREKKLNGSGPRRQSLMYQDRHALITRHDEGCSLLLKRLDEMVLKPLFIKDYQKRKAEIEGGHRKDHILAKFLKNKGRKDYSIPERDEEKLDGASFQDSSFSLGDESFTENGQSNLDENDRFR